MNRLDYVRENRERYETWLAEIETSPYGPLDMCEFAIISAHCAMEKAIGAKNVTYDFARLMPGATQVSCSAFGQEMIALM